MNNSIIHLNNAGASLVSEKVLSAQLEYLQIEAQNGGYETAEKFDSQLEEFYSEAAKFINARADEIAFTESATVAWQRSFFSIPFEDGDIILTSKIEYASNFIAFLNLQKEKKINIKVIPSTGTGEVDLKELENLISPQVKLIAITHIPTNGGIVNPAEEVGKIASAHNILYLLDSCQSVGQYPLDVKKIQCDFLTATGRKFLRGPRGTGFLFIKKATIERLRPQNLDLHSAEWTSINSYEQRQDGRAFETWETNLAAKLGLTIALKAANEMGSTEIWKQITALSNYMREQLSAINNIDVHDLGIVKSGIITLTSHIPADEIQSELAKANINVSLTSKNGTLLDMEERHLDKMIRASVHYYNTKEEIDTFIKTLKSIVS
ncbi:aminotransferase class V-fold PLP-dependent enzyme [Fulvivirga ligni]|uniref:aminotransferase class V-fold PLP-dependent enzyme n=1 Tax=Fulvivirga ligni TaxID=2904246 RepID=UPI001F252116|nr:aminotransferase class V-fold PLP-dependent enzyme [Fulvivirga ligni]UII22157.1 aminotransferase class V-fold PLP-dependent enzyme [Fulvivirga ligni]